LRTTTGLAPGATATEFAARADMENSRLFKLGRMRSADVAKAVYRAMLKGKTLVIPGMKNWVMAEAVRFGPRKLVTAIARAVQERPN
jgi:short-subunit dehydrogenase